MYNYIHNYIIFTDIGIYNRIGGVKNMNKNKIKLSGIYDGVFAQTDFPAPYNIAKMVPYGNNCCRFEFDNKAIQLSKYGTELNLQKIPKHKFLIQWTDTNVLCESHIIWHIARASQKCPILLQYTDEVREI